MSYRFTTNGDFLFVIVTDISKYIKGDNFGYPIGNIIGSIGIILQATLYSLHIKVGKNI